MARKAKTGMLTGKTDKPAMPTKDTTPPKTGGVKPMRDVKGDSTPSEMTFTFFEGAERGDASPTSLYGSREAEQLTEAELRDYFEGDKVNRLPEVFGTFDNYLAYMTEREQLIQSGDYDVGNWDEYTGSLTEDDLMILGGEDLTQYGDDASSTYEELYGERTQNQAAAYENWVNSEANQALLQKYGVNDTVYSETGDKFRWNGSAYVKTVEEDHAGLTDYVKMAMVTAMTAMSGGALTPYLGTAGAAVGSSAISQAITTGSIDPAQLLTSAATAGITQALSDFVGPAFESATGLNLSELTSGNAMVDDALKAMGNSIITQGVINGDVDIEQVFTAGLFTTLDDVVDFFFNDEEQSQELWSNIQGKQREALNQQLEENFNTTVAGLVDAMDAEAAATFANLTADLTEQFTAEGTWEGTPDYSLPDTATASQYVEESLRGTSLDPATYDNLTDDAARSYMEQSGFSDEEIDTYLNFRQPPEVPNGLLEFSNTGMMADPDQDFSINVRRGEDGDEYFIVRNNGDYKAISEADAQALMNFEDADDWEGFVKYMDDKGITGGGVVFGGFTDDGRPILSGVETEDWLTSTDSQPRYLDVEFVDDPFESTIPEPEIPEDTVEPEPVEPEPVEPEPVEPDPVDPVDPTDTTDTTDPGNAGVGTPAVDTLVGGMLTGDETPTGPPLQPPVQPPVQLPV